MSNEDIQQQVKSHQKIFVSLAILTLASAGIAMSGLGGTPGIIVAMCIAFTQGLLILGKLMHLNESSSVKGLLALTAFFVAYLLFATCLAFMNQIEGTDHLHYTPPPVEESHAEEAHEE